MGEELRRRDALPLLLRFPRRSRGRGARGAAARVLRASRASATPQARARIPDPNDEATFAASRLDWGSLEEPAHTRWLELHRELLRLRLRVIAPRLGEKPARGTFGVAGASGVSIDWTLADGSRLHMRANFGDGTALLVPAAGEPIHVEGETPRAGSVPAWSGVWTLEA